MELRSQATIPFSPRAVFTACRDDIASLSAHLRGVRSIEVVSRTERDTKVDTVVEWRTGAHVPSPLRALIGRGVFEWTDHATWDAETLSVDWWSESALLGGAVRCSARDVFAPSGDGHTVLSVLGQVVIVPEEIRGVFSPFRGPAARWFEPRIAKWTGGSVERMAAALTAHLRSGR